MALAVADLDADDDAIERRQRALELQPAVAAPAGRVGRVGVLDHQALVAALLRRVEDRPTAPARVDGGEQVAVAMPGHVWQAQRVEKRAPLAQRQTSAVGSTRCAAALAECEQVERNVDDRHLCLHLRRRVLAAEALLQLDERQRHAVTKREHLAVEDAVPWLRRGGGDDLRVAVADVVAGRG